jgi:predicted DNA-binding transcriptional regulator AlpA
VVFGICLTFEVVSEWKAGKITAVEAMKKLGMKKTAFYKVVNKFKGL